MRLGGTAEAVPFPGWARALPSWSPCSAGLVASHPFAQNAKGWGSPHFVLSQAKTKSAEEVPGFAVLGVGVVVGISAGTKEQRPVAGHHVHGQDVPGIFGLNINGD